MTRRFSQTLSLTPEQRREFLEAGVTRLRGAIPADAVAAMADHIWRAFTRRFGFQRDQPETWTTPGAAAVMQPVLTQMANSGVFAGMLSPAVEVVLDDIFGKQRWQAPRLPPRPLGLIFPTPGRAWSVPTRHWHFDYGVARPTDAGDHAWPERVRLFGYLGSIETSGGGTFYVAGSHRAAALVAADIWATSTRCSSSMVVGRLKRDSDWFAELCSKREEDPGRVNRFMGEGGMFRDVPLRVAEMTGEPGDVLIWHPNLLHAAPSSNQRQAPRLVLSTTVDAGVVAAP